MNSKKLVKDIDVVDRLRKILLLQIAALMLLGVSLLSIQTALAKGPVPLLINILLGIVIVVAVLFTSYLFYLIIKEKRYGWITIFFFMVVLPCLLVLLIFWGYIFLTTWLLVPIGLFVLYCFILRYSIADWLKEYYAHEQLEEQRKESAKRKEEEMKWGL